MPKLFVQHRDKFPKSSAYDESDPENDEIRLGISASVCVCVVRLQRPPRPFSCGLKAMSGNNAVLQFLFCEVSLETVIDAPIEFESPVLPWH